MFPEVSKFRNDNAKRLIFGHLNINSLRNKLEILEMLTKGYIHIFCVAETKLDDSFPNATFYVDGFKIHRIDRNQNGGGLLCYVNTVISHRPRPDVAVNANDIESIVIEVETKSEKYFIVFMYRAPSAPLCHFINATEIIYDMCLQESTTACISDRRFKC